MDEKVYYSRFDKRSNPGKASTTKIHMRELIERIHMKWIDSLPPNLTPGPDVILVNSAQVQVWVWAQAVCSLPISAMVSPGNARTAVAYSWRRKHT